MNIAPETMSHFAELRHRLMISFGIVLVLMVGAYMFVDHILAFLIAPLADAMGNESTQRLIYTNLTEAFLTNIKLSFYTALFIGLPIILMQVWLFVAPGLYAKEKNAFLPFFSSDFVSPSMQLNLCHISTILPAPQTEQFSG